MNRDEFSSLPLSLALGLIYDMARAKLEPIEAPKVPYSPKFDGRLSRKNRQYCWMSEMDLSSLEYWHNIYLEKPQDSEWADKDRKTATALGYWVEWRRCFPNAIWTGERNHEKVEAFAPGRDPEMHDWEERGAAPAPRRERSFDDSPKVSPDDDSDIPF